MFPADVCPCRANSIKHRRLRREREGLFVRHSFFVFSFTTRCSSVWEGGKGVVGREKIRSSRMDGLGDPTEAGDYSNPSRLIILFLVSYLPARAASNGFTLFTNLPGTQGGCSVFDTSSNI